MADLQCVLPHDDPIDEQLQDPLLLGEGRLLEPRPHPLAERLQVGPDLLGRLALAPQSLFLVPLGREYQPPPPDLLTAPLEFVEVDHLGLVGIDQPLFLAIEPAQQGLALLARRIGAGIERIGLPGPFLELRRQRGRVVEQPLDMIPDGRVELLDPGARLGTGTVAVPCQRVFTMTYIVAMPAPPAGPAAGDAAHGEAARPAGEQAAEQVVVASVVAERQGRVPGELLARGLISHGVDDGRHRDGDPFLARRGLRQLGVPALGPVQRGLRGATCANRLA